MSGTLMFCGPAALVGLACLHFSRRRALVDPYPRCRRCRYIVRGLVGSKCPECGSDLRQGGTIRRCRFALSDDSRLALWASFLVLTLMLPEFAAWNAVYPKLPRSRSFDDRIYFDTPVSRQYDEVTIRHTGAGWGTQWPLPKEISIELEARGHLLIIEPGTWHYRYTRADGQAVFGDSLDHDALLRWMADCGVADAAPNLAANANRRRVARLATEADTLILAVHACDAPLDQIFIRSNAGFAGTSRESSRSASVSLYFEFIPVLYGAALLVFSLLYWKWSRPTLERVYQWHDPALAPEFGIRPPS